jgi:hypothetical protein
LDGVSDSYAEGDPLVRDLLEMAATYALARADATLASTRIERIENPAVRVLAKLAQRQGSANGSLAADLLQILESAGDDVSPLHRAKLAATAVLACQSANLSADEIFKWGLAQLESADSMMITRGLTALAPLAPQEQRVGFLTQALSASEGIGNQYLRGDAVSDLLAVVIELADGDLVSNSLDRLLDEGWTTFVNSLGRAMPSIVHRNGVDIVQGIDSAMRKAQGVLTRSPATAKPAHFDGVLAGQERERAATGMMEAQRSTELYLSTYLDQNDLPSMPWVQDSRVSGSDPGDTAFARFHGRVSGLSAWQRDFDQTIWRIVDIRFLFDNAEDAAAYHQERLTYNSEGNPAVSGAPTVGEECFVYGGANSMEMAGVTVTLTTYFYIFRVGRVVAKLFVAQGPNAKDPLTLEAVVPLSERIAQRIRNAFQ